MTASLVRAGVRVLAYDRSEAALAKAVAAGAHAAESPQAIGATPGACAALSRVLQSYMLLLLLQVAVMPCSPAAIPPPPVLDRHQGRGALLRVTACRAPHQV